MARVLDHPDPPTACPNCSLVNVLDHCAELTGASIN